MTRPKPRTNRGLTPRTNRTSESRTNRIVAIIGVVVGVLTVLVALGDWLLPDGLFGGTTTTTAATTGQPTTTAPTTPPCGSPAVAEGISAAFTEPCQEGRIDGAFPTVKVAIPRYPGEGRLVIVSRMLTTENGMPHARPPIYSQTTVDARTAEPDKSGPGVWGKALFVGEDKVCTKAGRAELSLYLLTPAGAQEAEGWQPGVELTIPEGSTKLDHVVITRVDSGC